VERGRVARDIASVADKDIREDFGGPDEVPPSERPRSEGGPATRELAQPPSGEMVPPTASAQLSEAFEAEPPVTDPVSEPAVAVEAPPQAVDPGPVPAAPVTAEVASPVAEARERQPAPDVVAPLQRVEPEASPDVSLPPDLAREPEAGPVATAMPPDVAPDAVSDTAEPWRDAIAGALAEPSSAPEVPAHDSPREEPVADRPTGDAPVAGQTDGSFTSAAEDLFRPPPIEEEPHLITLGRRLNPSLRIPFPVPPDIPPRAEPVIAPLPWWKTTPWRDRLRTAGRYAAYAIGGYLVLVLVLIILFRFVNPPGSMLMLTQFLTGTSIDRRWVPLESISRNLVRAVIVSEDGRFCEHSGIDTAAIREAIDRASRGTPRGASTISMQVTKNLFLWNAKSYVRKVIEIPLTLYMEIIWPKTRILEVYLNIAEWGPGVFGAEAAARHHFGKSAARLSERESALLAAALPNPAVRNPAAPNRQTSAKARVVQSRVKAYGTVASCVTPAAAAPAVQAPVVSPRTIRKAPPKPAPRKKQPPVDAWSPMINFGSP
jgi:monofunctional biosynthetic peptidoglycan transglycosylase